MCCYLRNNKKLYLDPPLVNNNNDFFRFNMANYAGVLSTHHREYQMPSAAEADSIKRRSSSRNIKRPKFDDELVESSLGGGQGLSPLPKFRTRNTSVSIVESPTPITPVRLV